MSTAQETTIRQRAPLLLPFVTSRDVRTELRLNVLETVLDAMDKVYDRPEPGPEVYTVPNPSQTDLEYFPNHPLIRGPAKYAANKSKKDDSGCRKWGKRHATLSPGLFTIVCKHGICLGFQLMSDTESPKTAFHILMGRFPTLPKLIIYDNACKMHVYCIKREPARFALTRFMVDRMHYRGHIGCSEGYNMDTYKADVEIAKTNSQANEQANASLRNISTQIAYMSIDNVLCHTGVFLAIRNQDKQIALARR